jgi:hypothetical protein
VIYLLLNVLVWAQGQLRILKNVWTIYIQVSHKSGAKWKLCYLAKYGKNIKRENCCKSCVSSLKCWNFLPRRNRYSTTFLTSSVVESYGYVATLILEFASCCCLSGSESDAFKSVLCVPPLIVHNFHIYVSYRSQLGLVHNHKRCRQTVFADSLPTTFPDCRQTLFCVQTSHCSVS